MAPTVVERAAQPYVGVRELITMDSFDRLADQLPALFSWLAERGVDAVGPPFFRYLTIDMDRELDVEAGIPVTGLVGVDGAVFARTLPAGRFVTVTHVGHPDGLIDATAALLRWAAAEGLAWDVRDTPPGQAQGCRLEVFHTDPREQPDMNRWETELVLRLADEQGDAAS